MRSAFIRAVGVRAHHVLRRIFPFVNKGVHAPAVPFMAGVAAAGTRVVLMRAFVTVGPMAVVLMLHRRVPSARVVHGAALCVPFRVPRLRQLLMLGDRPAIKFFRHRIDSTQNVCADTSVAVSYR